MPCKLRDYSPADFERLYEIDQACYARGIAYSRAMLRWYLKQRGSFCVVAEADGVPESSGVGVAGSIIAGFIIAQGDGEAGYTVTIDVLEGQRRGGVGTALLEEAERRLASMGVRYIELHTATNNEAGIAFWQRHGYRSSGISPGYYLGRIDAYRMSKRLATKPAKAAN
jgi:[ribosomal protein S18]-alanine N-acetyltransferase